MVSQIWLVRVRVKVRDMVRVRLSCKILVAKFCH